MMIRALNTIALVVAVVLAFALYRAKTEAHAARERLDTLTVLVEEERRAAAVLRAEIAFLERPERLRALAERHLGLTPTAPTQETTLEATLLALGEPAAVDAATRYAAAAPRPAAPAAAPAPVALAEAQPRPAVMESAPARLAAIDPIETAPLPPAQPVRRVAEAAPPAALRPAAEDPIAGLIVAVGGMR